MGFNHSGILLTGESNIGLNRRRNEDGFLLSAPSGGPYSLALIADGIGGHADGDLASAICCRDMLTVFTQTPPDAWSASLLQQTLEKISRKIFDRNFRERRSRPMGCTVVAALFSRENVIFAHAGDSRLYEFCENNGPASLRQLTHDHVPTPAQMAQICPGRSADGIILRSLGTRLQARVEVHCIHRLPGASFLLCTDGFYRGITHSQITGILRRPLPPREITSQLMRQALLGRSMDNITLILASPEKEVDHVSA